MHKNKLLVSSFSGETIFLFCHESARYYYITQKLNFVIKIISGVNILVSHIVT